MKKIKRILAILGAIILAGLYISTIVCALSSNENYMDMLMASVYATVIIPVLIWHILLYIRWSRKIMSRRKINFPLLIFLSLF